jgi:hypothetical protein
MASNQAVRSTVNVAETKELAFAGDGVRLAGQIDYPQMARPVNGYPLLFILHHAGCNTRECYDHYAESALKAGYAVFRWDKRGTGRSGAGGRGSTTQDAVNAYEIGLEQSNVNSRRVVILAQGAGTALLGSSYGLFARQQHPSGVILVANMLDEVDILAIDAPLKILLGQEDWNPWKKFAEAVCNAHNDAYKYGASYYIAPHANRMLEDTRFEGEVFHEEAKKVIEDWLKSLTPTSASV